MAGVISPPVFQSSEHDFNFMALTVDHGVVRVWILRAHATSCNTSLSRLRFATNRLRLTCHLNHRSIFCQLQYEGYLLFAEPTLLHAKISLLTNAKPDRDFSHKKWTNLKRSGQLPTTISSTSDARRRTNS
jgi:hypothetical protein